MMDTQKIINEYASAQNKTVIIRELSKEYGVPKSNIICELFKSGYKYAELQHAYPYDYSSAQNKYKKFLETVETAETEGTENISEEETVSSTNDVSNTNADLITKIEELTIENEKLKAEIKTLKNNKDSLRLKIAERMLLDSIYERAGLDLV